MRRFSFFRRNGIFYCQLFNELTHKWGTAKSTGTRSKDDAYLVAFDWLKNGIPSGRSRIIRPAADVFNLDIVLAIDFLRTFWDEERSPYIRSERARGREISLRQIRESAVIAEKRWAPLLGDIQLGVLRKADIRQALVNLSERGGEGASNPPLGTTSSTANASTTGTPALTRSRPPGTNMPII